MASSTEPWLVTATRYSRLVRPFNLKPLVDALYFVEADGADIRHRLQKMLIDPPRLADDLCAELDALEASLRSLSARCGDVLPVLAQMVDRADGEEKRALDALLLVWQGIGEAMVESEAIAA